MIDVNIISHVHSQENIMQVLKKLEKPEGNYIGKPMILHFDVFRRCKEELQEEWLTKKNVRKAALTKAMSIVAKRTELSDANAILFGEYSYTICSGCPDTIVFASTVMAVAFFKI